MTDKIVEDGMAAPATGAPVTQTVGMAEPKLPIKAQMVSRKTLAKIKEKKPNKKQLAEEYQIIADMLVDDTGEVVFIEA